MQKQQEIGVVKLDTYIIPSVSPGAEGKDCSHNQWCRLFERKESLLVPGNALVDVSAGEYVDIFAYLFDSALSIAPHMLVSI